MYWQRLTNGKYQKVLPFRVYPWPRTVEKPVCIPTKDHLKHGLFMENYAKFNKTSITALIEERHLHPGKKNGDNK